MLDIAIIGAGPAGLSAAINAAQRNKKVKVFGRNISSSLLYSAENVDNYLGMSEVTGRDMMNTFYNHAVKKGVEIQEGRVLQIFMMEDYYALNVDNEFVEAKAVIIASGLNVNRSLPGEAEYLGKGVSYCATCDGMLYKNKTVIVIGESKEGEADAEFLNEICSKVYYIPLYADAVEISSGIEILSGKAERVLGDEFVKAVEVDGNLITCDGAFFIKKTTPVTSLVDGLEMEGNTIKVNRVMETNLKNIFAAGDCTGRPFQVSKAVGEGLIAAQQAVLNINIKTNK